MTYFFKTVGSFISKLVGQVKGETWPDGKCENSFRVFSDIKWKQCQSMMSLPKMLLQSEAFWMDEVWRGGACQIQGGCSCPKMELASLDTDTFPHS